MALSTFHDSVSHGPFSTGVLAMSRLILLGFRELNKLKFPLMVLPFFPNALLSYVAFAFYFKKLPTQFGPQKFSLLAEICLTCFGRHVVKNNHYLETGIQNNSADNAFPCETWFSH